MTRRLMLALAVTFALCMPAAAQSQQEYLDVMIVKVKPEKRAEFDQIARKIASANRKNGGDAWLAAETVYGEGNTIYFSSARNSYGEIEKSYDAFMAAMTKGMGQAAAVKLLQDFNSCIVSSRSEMRRRRPELSVNAPTNVAERSRVTGESRWYRTTAVRIRPGHLGQYEDLLKTIKAARDQKGGAMMTAISQSAAGQMGTVFYLTTLVKTLSGFDQPGPTIRELLGEEGYKNYVKVSQEAVLGTESYINRYVPEFSSPPEAVTAVDPAFWNPKPPAAPKAKEAPTKQ